MFYSNLFIIFGTTEFETPSRAKKKTDRTRGAIEVDNVAQSDLSTKILVLHLSCNAMGPKNLWNCIYRAWLDQDEKKIANVLLDYPDEEKY